MCKGSTEVSSNDYFFPSLLQPYTILLTMKYKTPYRVGSRLTSKKGTITDTCSNECNTQLCIWGEGRGGEGLFHH